MTRPLPRWYRQPSCRHENTTETRTWHGRLVIDWCDNCGASRWPGRGWGEKR